MSEQQGNTDNLSNAILDNASGAQQVTTDGTTTRTHSLQDQIAADKYLRARKRRGPILRLYRTRPGGAA